MQRRDLFIGHSEFVLRGGIVVQDTPCFEVGGRGVHPTGSSAPWATRPHFPGQRLTLRRGPLRAHVPPPAGGRAGGERLQSAGPGAVHQPEEAGRQRRVLGAPDGGARGQAPSSREANNNGGACFRSCPRTSLLVTGTDGWMRDRPKLVFNTSASFPKHHLCLSPPRFLPTLFKVIQLGTISGGPGTKV